MSRNINIINNTDHIIYANYTGSAYYKRWTYIQSGSVKTMYGTITTNYPIKLSTSKSANGMFYDEKVDKGGTITIKDNNNVTFKKISDEEFEKLKIIDKKKKDESDATMVTFGYIILGLGIAGFLGFSWNS
uniref:Uncharacterized protein n=1 Tax=viral metagenome TaxID=1070528 RepID=A0A6C0JBR2_9ZZZZ